MKACELCGSQKTSIQRANGAQAVSISPVTRATYSERQSANSGGTTCAPKNVVSEVNSAAMRSDLASSRTLSPYPLLISTVVVPWARISATRAATRVRSSSSVAPRVAPTDVAIPPASYRVPVIRAENSWERSPAKTRCECESTKPGTTARPPTS